MEKIVTLGNLKSIREKLRGNNEKVVFTNGCFDLLHPGHVRYLSQARKLGDKLIVAINSNRAVKELKGKSRPILNEDERAEVIAALSSVDYVVIFDDVSPEWTIQELLPDVLVKGGDWKLDEIIGANDVLAAGGEVLSLSFVDGVSTSEIINRILRSHK